MYGYVHQTHLEKIPVDRDTQIQGGTRGFRLNSGASNKYYFDAEYRSAYLRILRKTLDLGQVELKHHDPQKNRMQRNEFGVQRLEQILEGTWINPFSGESQECVCIQRDAPQPRIF